MNAVDIGRVPLERIVIDTRAQARVRIDVSTIDDYAAAMRDGVEFPPVVVFRDPTVGGWPKYWLADGFHRVPAAQRCEFYDIPAELHVGTLRDAVRYALGANVHHGLRRTNADKRRAVELALADPEWAAWSDRAIAELCAVDHKTVGSVRASSGEVPQSTRALPSGEVPQSEPDALTGEVPQSTQPRVGRDGRVYDVSKLRSRTVADEVQAGLDAEALLEDDWTGDDVGEEEESTDIEPEVAAAILAEIRAEEKAAATQSGMRWVDGLGLVLADEEAEVAATSPKRPRDPLDRYYTPARHALACTRWLAENVLPAAPASIVEPSCGAGDWVRAARAVWPGVFVDRFDADPDAEGLALDLQGGSGECVSWLNDLQVDERWHLALGNPPYDGFVEHIDRCLERADYVAMLLRTTALGAALRIDWWQSTRPTWIVTVLPRPVWHGPGARPDSDSIDSVLVVWTPARPRHPLHAWLHCPDEVTE